MQVQFLNAPDFTIDHQGVLQRRSVWLLRCDESEGDISTLAAAWAGSINDPWKQPISDGSAFLPDTSLKVIDIKCTALDSRTCRVEFTAAQTAAPDTPPQESDQGTLQLSEERFERRKDLSEYKIALFYLESSQLSELPAVGDLIDWAGSNYRCESLKTRFIEENKYEVELTAVNTALQAPSEIVSSTDNQNRRTQIGCWLVNDDALADFLQNNALHQPAQWAGENFYISEIKTRPAHSARRTEVTLTARHVELRMLEKTAHSEIVSIADNTPVSITVWHSRWLAGNEDTEVFTSMLGKTADWTGDEKMLVCEVTPQAISDHEYEIELEARYAEHINSTNGRWWRDIGLDERVEYQTRIGEIRLSAQQCGYYWRGSGWYRPIYNWNSQNDCPLSTTSRLPRAMINRSQRVLEIVVKSYLSGTSGENIDEVCSWFYSRRVENKTLVGITGNFLRYDLEVKDITDSRDRQWTQISKVYRLAPGQYNWNPTYWY